MNPELQAKIDEARANGYSEEEIQRYLSDQNITISQPEMDRSEEYAGLAQGIGLEAAKTAATLGGSYLVGKKLLKGLGNSLGRGPVAPASPTAPGAVGPVSPEMRTFEVLKTSSEELRAQEAARKAQQAASQARQPGMVQRVAQMAYDKIAPAARAAAPYARGGIGGMAALMPGNTGQNYPFPTSGPMRGSEINPQTGRPWTRQELDAYYAQQR